MLLMLPGELRNRIYEYILAQCPTRRNWVWMSRQTNRKRRQNIPVYRWDTARPYMGLMQACRTLRNEFRPLYLGEMRFSTNFDDLPYLLDMFGPTEVKRDLEGLLQDLKRSPIPPPGIDLLDLIERLRNNQDKFRVRSHWRRKSDEILITGYIATWWLQLREDSIAILRTITDMRLYSRSDSAVTPAQKHKIDTVLQIRIQGEGNDAHNEEMADSFGKLFIHMAHFKRLFQVIIESHCGTSRIDWKIDFKAEVKSCELFRRNELRGSNVDDV